VLPFAPEETSMISITPGLKPNGRRVAFRVERAALTVELPETIKGEGVAKASADAAVDAWAAFKTEVAEWVEMVDGAIDIARRAEAICEETGATKKTLGTFQSHRLGEHRREL
jgi:hypothetical protein